MNGERASPFGPMLSHIYIPNSKPYTRIVYTPSKEASLFSIFLLLFSFLFFSSPQSSTCLPPNWTIFPLLLFFRLITPSILRLRWAISSGFQPPPLITLKFWIQYKISERDNSVFRAIDHRLLPKRLIFERERKRKERTLERVEGRDGHEGVELLHLVGERKGGKPFVRFIGKGVREKEETKWGDWRSKRRGEVLQDRGGGRKRGRGRARELKEGLREGQTEEERKKNRERGVYRLIDSRGFRPSLPSQILPLSPSFHAVGFPFRSFSLRCVRMFMRVQGTRVRGYANRMIDTLAGWLPSHLIFYSVRWIDFPRWRRGSGKGVAGAW